MRAVPTVCVSDGHGGFLRVREEDVDGRDLLDAEQVAAIEARHRNPPPPAGAGPATGAGGEQNHDGPTLEEHVAAGGKSKAYPPAGFAERPSPGLSRYRDALEYFGKTKAEDVLAEIAQWPEPRASADDVDRLEWALRAEMDGRDRSTVKKALHERIDAVKALLAQAPPQP